ncbi:hypothetical protein [Methylosinus sp. PW1]|uniref:hypothetical protein n=1 Tax=Methylosinus sp. PW1 TaxID=107636 RepID=UPI000B170A26|nr:hypothetical protein [Methylosinus sp. PW1]
MRQNRTFGKAPNSMIVGVRAETDERLEIDIGRDIATNGVRHCERREARPRLLRRYGRSSRNTLAFGVICFIVTNGAPHVDPLCSSLYRG